MFQAAEPAPANAPGTILVVDDEPVVREIVQIVLEGAGFEVLHAEDGVSGLIAAREAGSGLRGIVLDLTLPRMGGQQVLTQLRNEGNTVPVLLMSGYSEHELHGKYAQHEQTGFVQKPFTAEELLSAVHRVLGG